MNSHKLSTGLLVVVVVALVVSASVSAYEGRILARNMNGSDVQEVQKMLESLGYDIEVDGKFGVRTENAVRTFQQDNGIIADGIVGPETLKVLRALGYNQVHRVKRGESLSKIAVLYGTSVSSIMDANDLTDDTIYVGQKLIIPGSSRTNAAQASSPQGGDAVAKKEQKPISQGGSPAMMTYQVQPGESTYVIAKKFNTTITAIAEANGLKDPSKLRAGQKLLIPNVSGKAVTEAFRWPVQGRITSGYGWRVHPIYKNRQFHGGIDIAVPTGTIVRAAASGKVIRAGDMAGFGLGVVIDHGNGVTTWYGHNSRILVKVGQEVVRGQAIANSGSTGVSTGPHVDFRIKVNGNTVNPLYWLP